MTLQIPESMEECLYFTNRDKVMAWVYRKTCPKCKKTKMGKPQGKEGSIKTKALEYVCPSCKYTEDKAIHEASLKLEAHYTCPKCGKEGESTGEYKRKNYQGVPSYVIQCQHCGETIALTKKMKKLKGKKSRNKDLDEEES